ncbi:alpha-1,4-N-acetylglucosaminyltransferase EXTL3 [Apostasia shenzhenica]|uniref:Glucosamine inositolphosphorylceramide transferase 1 n=1 Tax=Apostasia shenzhenica TaxID=1088818 RepID=A0A2I0ANZ5_9ASPA|nr:alpha-1,4-N-acetylglucosaminyltransferase EXTL3 [Apostasia shenzhenica]
MRVMGEKGAKAGAWRLRWRRWSRPLGALARPSAPVFFLLGSLLASCVVGIVFFRLWVSSFLTADPVAAGCFPDGEGSWSIGIFYGKSPFSLAPIELSNRSNEKSSAWPVSNPVLTCASVSIAGYPSNFVADPFLFIQENTFFLFFETKNVATMQGDIGVARSLDQGATWEVLGIALDEAWHLSYPYIFSYNNETYLMPEGSKKGDLRLYRATKFPLKWTFEKILVHKPLIDTSMVQYSGYYWLFTSDSSRSGTEKNAELEIWYSKSPLGPWKEHRKNPIYRTDKSLGARNGGRPFIYKGNLYRLGQDCSGTYGRRLQIYKVEKLTVDEYKEVPSSLFIGVTKKGRNSWHGVRYHHLDPQQLSSGGWVAVMDGDRVPSGDSTRAIILGWVFMLLVFFLIMFVGLLVGVMDCIHLQGNSLIYSRRTEQSSFGAYPNFGAKIRRSLLFMLRCILSFKGRVNLKTCQGKFFLSFVCILGVFLICIAVQFLFGGNGAEEAYMFKGQYSQFTMVTMTYDARLWNLKEYVKHYSRCASVREIVVVWNKGIPPTEDEFDSAVPVRIRIEKLNSLNNRFRVDPLIQTRVVLELDDDILMTCNDVEKGFRVWRENPERIVGFYPRLLEGDPLKYRDEKYARKKNGYNVILTGAAFMDSELAFNRYWSERARAGRDLVDKFFNCEDILMNFLYANLSSARTVEYVHPTWAIDTSKFSASAISRNTQAHYGIRTECLSKFSDIYGSLPMNRWNFGTRKDGWDV